jgi:hypothetical protein
MYWPSCTHLEFIVDHVTETLIEYTPDVDVGIELCAEDTRVHWLVAMIIITSFGKLFAKIVRCSIFFIKPDVTTGGESNYLNGVAS